MSEPLHFRCSTCDEVHVGLPAWHFGAPVQVYGVPEDEMERRVDLGTDDCVIEAPDAPDGRWFFAKGLLEIPVHGVDEPFTWGVWLSLSRASFDRFRELFDDAGREEGESFFGWLSCAIPGYPDTQSLRARLHVRPYPLRPRVELEPTAHPLAVDQRAGIPAERAIAIAEGLLHPPEG
jgi:hypothetical protein